MTNPTPETAAIQIAAAKERERRRRRIRADAAKRVAAWPESLRRRMARDFAHVDNPPEQTTGENA